MNYYERIQKSLDYIEANLENEIDLNRTCGEAYMSMSNFYRMFFALVGYPLKEYIRHRRISLAADELTTGNAPIIDIGLKYGFESQDSFSRAFKRITGFLPSEFRKDKKSYSFERMYIMDKYFEIQDKELLEKYPDIKVLKRLEPMRVAYYKHFGKGPEDNALKVIKDWAYSNNLLTEKAHYRIFGFDSPDSKPGDTEYGYEVWLTIDDIIIVNDEKVKEKIFDGGLYAVTSTTVSEVVKTWDRFRKWLKAGKYGLGSHQCLEEHLPFWEWEKEKVPGDHKLDLYMPIKEKEDKAKEEIQPVCVAFFRAHGTEKNAPFEANGKMLAWAIRNDLFNKSKEYRLFTYNNFWFEKDKNKHWYESMMTIDNDMDINDCDIKKKQFPGGNYITSWTIGKNLPKAWREMIRWQEITKTTIGNHHFVEEWIVENNRISMDSKVKIYLPI